MFVLKTALPGGTAAAGDQVRFNVQIEHNGPVATDVQAVSSKGRGKGGGPATVWNQPAAAFDPTYETSFVGTVKSFNPNSGWGMIESSLTFQLYGKDVFLSQKNLAGFSVSKGEKVRFFVKVEDKGPVAVCIQPLTQHMQFPVQAAPPSITPYYGGGYSLPTPVSSSASLPTHAFFGVIKGFNEEKGWGHIACDATMRLYNKDVFLLSGRLGEAVAEPGTLVSFKLKMTTKGPQADEVRVLPNGSFSIDEHLGEQHTGIVKSYNAEKCWGFIAGDHLHEIFGKDIFVNKRDLGEYVPSEGDQVWFKVAISEKDGQPYATEVTGTNNNSWKSAARLPMKTQRTTPY